MFGGRLRALHGRRPGRERRGVTEIGLAEVVDHKPEIGYGFSDVKGEVEGRVVREMEIERQAPRGQQSHRIEAPCQGENVAIGLPKMVVANADELALEAVELALGGGRGLEGGPTDDTQHARLLGGDVEQHPRFFRRRARLHQDQFRHMRRVEFAAEVGPAEVATDHVPACGAVGEPPHPGGVMSPKMDVRINCPPGSRHSHGRNRPLLIAAPRRET